MYKRCWKISKGQSEDIHWRTDNILQYSVTVKQVMVETIKLWPCNCLRVKRNVSCYTIHLTVHKMFYVKLYLFIAFLVYEKIHWYLITVFVTGLTQLVPLTEMGLLTLPEHLRYIPGFSGFCCSIFVSYWAYCIVCSSSL